MENCERMNDNTNVYLGDCMDFMRVLPDKCFDLAICDPPYGVGNFIPQSGKRVANNFECVTWNDQIPDKDYFIELNRVSCNLIIWGANYYNCFNGSNGAIVWDKHQENPKLSRCEIASQSYNQQVRYVSIPWAGFIGTHTRSDIHPCEKPVSLYKWLLKNYAKEGDKILDTHLGSQSSRIAAFDMGFDFTGYELDKAYFEAGNKRFNQHKAQLKLFV